MVIKNALASVAVKDVRAAVGGPPSRAAGRRSALS